MSIAVIDDYKLAWAKGYGVLTVGQDEAVTDQTLFHAGSVAKSLSAAATLTLVELGLLNLEDDVNNVLVSWQIPENEYTQVEKVTLRRLLSHSAGLQNGLTNRGPDDPLPSYITFGDEVPDTTLQQLLEGLPEDDIEPTRVVNVPGTTYRYANADYAILEPLVEDRLGQPFEDFMQATVLDRLGMAHSSYHQPLPKCHVVFIVCLFPPNHRSGCTRLDLAEGRLDCPCQFVNGILSGLRVNRLKSVEIVGKLTRQVTVFDINRDDGLTVSISLFYFPWNMLRARRL